MMKFLVYKTPEINDSVVQFSYKQIDTGDITQNPDLSKLATKLRDLIKSNSYSYDFAITFCENRVIRGQIPDGKTSALISHIEVPLSEEELLKFWDCFKLD